jgi:hypothetical protein
MPRKPSPDKQCAKCRQRKPLDGFIVGVPAEDLVRHKRGSRFCLDCRTTTKRCRRCKQDLPLVQFAGAWGDRYGWCKGCYSQARRTGYAMAAELFAEKERAKGRDPELSRGYRFYSQDPDEVLRALLRRRAARLRAAERDGLSGTSMVSPTLLDPSGSMNVRMFVTPRGPKTSWRFGDASQC